MKRACLFLLFMVMGLDAQTYPDQHHAYNLAALASSVEVLENVVLDPDLGFVLADGFTTGAVTFLADTSVQPFNRGLPSWNGHSPDGDSNFKVYMRFPDDASGWGEWLTCGFWREDSWSSYGRTSYSNGYVDYDWIKLYSYYDRWQFKVAFKRSSVYKASASIHKLSFMVSDSRTTDNVSITSIVADNPPAIYYPTNFVCQYNVDDEIGGSICSPTSTVMALASLGIVVDAYQFALDNYDDHFNMFGIWPRAVQNAAEQGVDAAVTRYRTWSQAYDTLAAGGRVVMSVGLPLYSGHLIMLAGFNSSGVPIVHDPARQDGEAHIFSKSELSKSWFNKGGVGYTLFPADRATLAADPEELRVPSTLSIAPNFPNPFNPVTRFRVSFPEATRASIRVFDPGGRLVTILAERDFAAGVYEITWNAETLPAGLYLIQVRTPAATEILRATLLK